MLSSKLDGTVFIGGYSKSGTTFLGRVLGLFEGVYAKGEEDFFRIFYKDMNRLCQEFNGNIGTVNKEVYDGQGTIPQMTVGSFRELNQKIFYHLYWGAGDAPTDCRWTVEKSPHNIFWLRQIEEIFPGSVKLSIIRDSKPVFRSFMRHMRDHRDAKFADPDFKLRKESMDHFIVRWNRVAKATEDYRSNLITISYDALSANTEAFIDFARQQIFKKQIPLTATIESISKEAYLKSLPKEARAKSLVQVGPSTISLSAEEETLLEEKCKLPQVSFDF